jgi:UDP-N-acetylmuramoyl-tripeptide--D-alanyl-D-alanine ligase
MSAFRWTSREVHRALGQDPGEAEGRTFSGVSTDTRSVSKGDLFVALSGENFDAHEFLGEAVEKGAAGLIVSRRPNGAPDGVEYFEVEHTLHALGLLARHRRRALSARVLGVTGTNGKTTTKDLLTAALGVRYRVHATEGNLNNQVGVPLTLLAAPDDAEVLVVEMGMNTPGEIGILAAIAEPQLGVVTSVGPGHLELVGSVHGVLIEKTSLLAGLPPGGRGFVAEEPEALPERARYLLGDDRLQVAGLSIGADLHPEGGAEGVQVQEDGTTLFRWHGEEVHLPLRGLHNVRNALLALGVAEAWGVEPAEAIRGIREMPQPKLRGEWRMIGGMRVIADCYNANPASVNAAVDILAAIPAEGEKIAVLGTMRELGVSSQRLHRQVAEQAFGRLGAGIDRMVATGEFVDAFAALPRAAADDRVIVAADPMEGYEAIAGSLKGDETILLKASRGEALERWIDRLESRQDPQTESR